MRRLVIGEPTGTLRVEVTHDHHPEQVRPATLKGKLHAYFGLTKPRIIELLLITTVPGDDRGRTRTPVPVADRRNPGGGIAGGRRRQRDQLLRGRDIDEIMPRTRRRPLPQHKISPPSALRFGTALGLISFGFLWATVNLVAAALAVGALLFYVFVYSVALKRTTPQNIVIGGAAGAVPVLVG